MSIGPTNGTRRSFLSRQQEAAWRNELVLVRTPRIENPVSDDWTRRPLELRAEIGPSLRSSTRRYIRVLLLLHSHAGLCSSPTSFSAIYVTPSLVQPISDTYSEAQDVQSH